MTRSPRISFPLRAAAALGLCTLALLAGCSMLGLTKPPEAAAAAAPKPPPPPIRVENPNGRMLRVGDEQAGATVVLERDQALTVRLPLLATSGLDWRLADVVPAVLSVGTPRFERAVRDTDAEEAAGDSIWLFKAQSPGTVTLQFELKRPRSLEPAQRSVTYTVTVK